MPGDETGTWQRSRVTASWIRSPKQAFDDLTLLASQICGTPMALITLLDADRQWFKSRRRHLRHRDVSQHRVL